MALKNEVEITANESKYLKYIYREQHEEFGRAKTTIIAGFFKVRPATVTETLQKLAQKGLLKHAPYHGVELTEVGVERARKLLRKHRLLEVLLVRFLNYDIQKACNEASRLEQHASDDLINTICRTYEHPKICPCNKTIFGDEGCGCKEQTNETEVHEEEGALCL